MNHFSRLGGATALLFCVPVFGQISTPSELGNACVSSAGNAVTLTGPTKLHVPGATSPVMVTVNSGCTITIASGASLEAEYAGLNFSGPLTIRATDKAEIKLVKSRIHAASITFDFSAPSSSMAVNESNLIATQGALSIGFTDDSKLEIVDDYPVAFNVSGLSAATSVTISGGTKFSALLDEAPIRALGGTYIALGGVDGNLILKKVPIFSAEGAIVISASGDKSNINVDESIWRMRDGVSVIAYGAESAINMKQAVFASMVNGTGTNGNVTVQSGSGSTQGGTIELNGFGVRDVMAISIGASVGGSNGKLKVENADITGQGDLRIESGAQGNTSVSNAELDTPTLVRVATGQGGSCSAQLRWAPTLTTNVQICP